MSNSAIYNPFTTNTLATQFESIKTRRVVNKARKIPTMDMSNPNPTQPFKGLNDRWYKITVPQGTYNCYLFAMGWIFSPHAPEYGLPGILSTGLIPQSKEDNIDFIISDLAKANRKVHEVIYGHDIPVHLSKAAPNTYWVKVYFIEDNPFSFHISRKDEKSGRWIHKLGWTEPPKVVCENLEFVGWYELLTTYYPEFKVYSPNELQSLASQIGYPLYGSISKSRWESRDNAGYNAYSADICPDAFIYFEPYCVMRIDE